MKIGSKEFSNHTYVMGILNVTPDSFSDGGKWDCIDRALRRAEVMISEGADVLDIGGESTRPGYTQISDNEEIERTAPVIEEIKKRFDIPVSIDTYKSAVAREALIKGADLVNDIWGFKYDENMAKTVKEFNASCCLMHNRDEAVYGDFMSDVLADLEESVKIAKSVGIADDKIMLDPGIGFAKSLEQNLYLTGRVEKLKKLGYPVLLGTSRKSMIGLTLDLPVEERLEGTLVTTVLAVQKGCLFVRVHDIKENIRTIKMAEAIAAC